MDIAALVAVPCGTLRVEVWSDGGNKARGIYPNLSMPAPYDVEWPHMPLMALGSMNRARLMCPTSYSAANVRLQT